MRLEETTRMLTKHNMGFNEDAACIEECARAQWGRHACKYRPPEWQATRAGMTLMKRFHQHSIFVPVQERNKCACTELLSTLISDGASNCALDFLNTETGSCRQSKLSSKFRYSFERRTFLHEILYRLCMCSFNIASPILTFHQQAIIIVVVIERSQSFKIKKK